MAFEINGSNGLYDKQIKDESVRYGRNAAANHKALVTSTINSAIEGEAPILDFSPSDKAFENNVKKLEKFADKHDEILNTMPPLDYQYRYMPPITDGKINKQALLGAAFEEMGETSIPVKKFEERFLPGNEYTVEALDLNKDGNIDITEYGTSMLAADMLSKDSPNISNIDGTMNSKGMNAVMEYSLKSRAEAATKLYSQINATYKLNELA